MGHVKGSELLRIANRHLAVGCCLVALPFAACSNETVENRCREGYDFADGTCTRAADVARVCERKDRDDCRAQCERGNARSCLRYGDGLRKVAPDAARAVWYKKSCDLGDAYGCTGYADYLMAGDAAGPAQYREAFAALSRGCAMDGAAACGMAASYLDSSLYGGPADPAGALRLWERACLLDDIGACTTAATIHIEGVPGDKGVPKDPQKGLGILVKGLGILVKSCADGSPNNCAYLADLLFEGKDGVAKAGPGTEGAPSTDPSAENDAASPVQDATPDSRPHRDAEVQKASRIFVTNEVYPPRAFVVPAKAPFQVADEPCQVRASVLGETWGAWLSTSTSSAYPRMKDGPWYLRVFASKSAIATAPEHAIDQDDGGTVVDWTRLVWIRTDASGPWMALTCNDWRVP